MSVQSGILFIITMLHYISGTITYLYNRQVSNQMEKREPGTELFFRGATPQVSSPQQRFTIEFGMESKWFHRANSTRKNVGSNCTDQNLQDCINLKANDYRSLYH